MAHRFRLPSPGVLGLLEILVLGSLAAVLVLWVVPTWLEIEWQCVGSSGVVRIPGDSYLAGVVVAGTFGWLFVAVGVLYAQIDDSRVGALLLPVAWFLVLVVGSLVAGLSMGSQLCPS